MTKRVPIYAHLFYCRSGAQKPSGSTEKAREPGLANTRAHAHTHANALEVEGHEAGQETRDRAITASAS